MALRFLFLSTSIFFFSTTPSDANQAAIPHHPIGTCEYLFGSGAHPKQLSGQHSKKAPDLLRQIRTRYSKVINEAHRVGSHHGYEREDLESIALIFLLQSPELTGAVSSRLRARFIDFFRNVSLREAGRNRRLINNCKALSLVQGRLIEKGRLNPTFEELRLAFNAETKQAFDAREFSSLINEAVRTAPPIVESSLRFKGSSPKLEEREFDRISEGVFGRSRLEGRDRDLGLDWIEKQYGLNQLDSALLDVIRQIVLADQSEKDYSQINRITVAQVTKRLAYARAELARLNDPEFSEPNHLTQEEIMLFSGEERKLLREYLILGRGQKELGEEFGISPAGISFRLTRLRKLFARFNASDHRKTYLQFFSLAESWDRAEWILGLSRLNPIETKLAFHLMVSKKGLGDFALRQKMSIDQARLIYKNMLERLKAKKPESFASSLNSTTLRD